MRKYTQKELREMVARGMAENITNAGNDERAKILDEENYLSQIGYSSGIYGCIDYLGILSGSVVAAI